MKAAPRAKVPDEQIARFADMFAAIGTEPRLRIMRLLLSAHPQGMVVSDIAAELEIPASTLSHHSTSSKMRTWRRCAALRQSHCARSTGSRRNDSGSRLGRRH